MSEHDSDVVENKPVRPSEKTTAAETAAQDSVIGGKDQQQNQQIHQDALDSNPNKHTGSANIENPNNNFESIQLIEAIPDSQMVRVLAARGQDKQENVNPNADTPSMVSLAAVGDQLSNNLLEMRRKVRQHMDAGPERDRVEAIMKDAATAPDAFVEIDTNKYDSKSRESAHEQKDLRNGPSTNRDKIVSDAQKNRKADEVTSETSQEHKAKTNSHNKSMRPSEPLDSGGNESMAPRTSENELADTHHAFKQITVKKGDTLWSIARKDLGEHADSAKLRTYADIIARDNKLAHPDRLEIGQRLVLRGVQADPIVEELAQSLPLPDEFKNLDPGAIERFDPTTPVVDGLTQRRQNQELERMLNAQYPDTVDAPVETVSEQAHDAIGKETGRAQMLDIGKKHGLDLAVSIDILEDRVARKQTTPEEVRKTFEQVERLLETESSFGVDKNKREILAQQILLHAAEPDKISQGMFNTCNVTTVECRVFERTPSVAAKIITDLALDGWTTVHAPDGRATTFAANPEVNDSKNALSVPPQSGQRSYASELFQVCAVNIHYLREGKGVFYEQLPVVYDRDTGELKDNGERLYVGAMEKSRDPYLPDNSFVDIHNAITGKSDTNFMLATENVLFGAKDGVTLIDSQKELETQLQKIDKAHGFPVIVKVNTAFEPFWSNGNFGAAGGAGGSDGGWHVVTIRGIDNGSPMGIKVDNQWNDEVDHLGKINSVSSEQLFQSMRFCSESLGDIGNKVRGGIRHDKRDLFEELDYQRLRLMNNQDLINSALDPTKPVPGLVPVGEIEKDVINVISTSFRKGNDLDDFQKENGIEKVDQIVMRLPPDSRIRVQQEEERLHMISHEDYLEKLVNFGRGVATLEGGSKIQQSALFHRLIAALPNSEERDLITDALESK